MNEEQVPVKKQLKKNLIITGLVILGLLLLYVASFGVLLFFFDIVYIFIYDDSGEDWTLYSLAGLYFDEEYTGINHGVDRNTFNVLNSIYRPILKRIHKKPENMDELVKSYKELIDKVFSKEGIDREKDNVQKITIKDLIDLEVLFIYIQTSDKDLTYDYFKPTRKLIKSR